MDTNTQDPLANTQQNYTARYLGVVLLENIDFYSNMRHVIKMIDGPVYPLTYRSGTSGVFLCQIC